MCGRYYIEVDEREMRDIVAEAERNIAVKTGEVFPTDVAPVRAPDGALTAMRWGFPRWDGKGQRPIVPADYQHVASFINEPDETLPGSELGRHGEARVLVRKEINGEVFRAVFEILHGKRNRALKLISLAIKTGQK